MSPKTAKLFLSGVCLISTNFDNLWHMIIFSLVHAHFVGSFCASVLAISENLYLTR